MNHQLFIFTIHGAPVYGSRGSRAQNLIKAVRLKGSVTNDNDYDLSPTPLIWVFP